MSVKLEKPIKNDWAKVLYILNDNFLGGINMLGVLTKYDQSFWKFSTRIGEVIKEFPELKIQCTKVPFKSKLTGKSGYTTFYTPMCTPHLLSKVYNQINKNGLKKQNNESSN